MSLVPYSQPVLSSIIAVATSLPGCLVCSALFVSQFVNQASSEAVGWGAHGDGLGSHSLQPGGEEAV